MKKAIALLVAAATVASMAVTSFASINDTNVIGRSGEIVTTTEIGFGTSPNGTSITDKLMPGTKYTFPLMANQNGTMVPLTKAMMVGYKFQISGIQNSSAVKSFTIVEEKASRAVGDYHAVIEVKDSFSTKDLKVKYNVKVVDEKTSALIMAQAVEFLVGAHSANQNVIDNLDKGDAVEVSNAAPVITTEQFKHIAEVNYYGKATLQGNGWSFTGNFTNETGKNFYTHNQPIVDLLLKLQNQEFGFITFAGEPTFNSFGDVVINVADHIDVFGGKIFTYRYLDGRLYKINGTYNKADQTVSFRTNKLGSFVFTNKEIKDGFIVSTDNTNNGSGTDGDKTNPDTGANGAVDTAVVLALVSLAAAGAVALKKVSK